MHPKLFGVIDSYYLMITIGIVFCFGFLHIFARKTALSRKAVLSIEIGGLVSIIVGVIFAILFQNLYDLIESPSSYHWTWAMTFYGGLIGGVLAFVAFYFVFIRRKDGKIIRPILRIAPALITVAHGFGRIGCFLAGCCYGKPTDSWLGVLFPGMSEKVYPTNLFEAIFLLVLSVVLLVLAMTRFMDYTFGVYGIAYGVFRFFIEYLRGDHRGAFIGSLSPSQFWSIVFVIGGIAFIVSILFLNRIKPSKQKA